MNGKLKKLALVSWDINCQHKPSDEESLQKCTRRHHGNLFSRTPQSRTTASDRAMVLSDRFEPRVMVAVDRYSPATFLDRQENYRRVAGWNETLTALASVRLIFRSGPQDFDCDLVGG